uniref:Putative Adenylate cyclase n=1 Tax=Magnetococcus massalia (strain MO-1) TaxID=451514 RepID=A0A1S7LKB9_MAGMO|nr:putative Adenylate cyclase [Candidatus Magnetococcus massalia]
MGMDRLRLISGLILLLYVTGHLANLFPGIWSLQAMNREFELWHELWESLAGKTLLYSAFILHLGTVFWGVARRRTLRLPALQIWQILLGLLIPWLMLRHWVAATGGESIWGLELDFRHVVALLWQGGWSSLVSQTAGVVVVWLHAMIGLHLWLRFKSWYPPWQGLLLVLAVVWPLLALAGFIAAGSEVQLRADQAQWWAVVEREGHITPEKLAEMTWVIGWVVTTYPLLLLLIFAGRQIRLWLLHRLSAVRLYYRDHHILPVTTGASVLETLQQAGIPHASVCGGRGRCTTCRVRLGEGGEALSPADAVEQRALRRVNLHGEEISSQQLRLACRIHPTEDLEVTPLLAPNCSYSESHLQPSHVTGEERELVVLFADLRGFTAMSEHRLPFDVVFILNRYFRAMGLSVEESGGYLDKFIGDGAMALFGLDVPVEQGCREALECLGRVHQRLAEVNEGLVNDLEQPLRVGIGVHMGRAVVGRLGHGQARQLTAIGDVVNTAARLESLCKPYGVAAIVSSDVMERSGFAHQHLQQHAISIRGRQQALQIYAAESLEDFIESSNKGLHGLKNGSD